MEYIVRTVEYQMTSPYCAWSLDATNNEELFDRTQQDAAKIVSISELQADSYESALALMDKNKMFLRSYIITSRSTLFNMTSSFACQIGVTYILAKDCDSLSVASFFVKRPEFSVEQLAIDLLCDFTNENPVALGFIRCDDIHYPNMLEKFVASCDQWWEFNRHYSYDSRMDVLKACRELGVKNNLQTLEC